MSDAEPPVAPTQPAQPAEPADGPDQRPYDPDRTRFLTAAVLWLAAAVLCILAAYQDVYRAGGNSLDAWGTFHGSVVESSAIHGPRYARIFVVCTVLFVLLAVSAAARAVGLRARRFDGTALAAGIAVSALLAGLVVALYLDVTSRLDGLRANQFALWKSNQSASPTIVTSIGHCAYLAVAAVLCGALAAAASGPRRREPLATA